MIRNYFIIAWRNILRNKAVSAINMAGLSLAFAFVLLIGGYIWKELQVNGSLKNINRQYIILSKWKESNMGPELATLAPLAEALKREYPHLVANYYRWDGITSSVSKGDKHFREEIQIGDSTFISMYGFKLLYGDAKNALNDPSSVVISSEAAVKYFGSVNVVGQALSIENFSGQKKDFTVSGVLDEMPHNSVTGLTTPGEAYIYMPPAAIAFFGRTPLDNWRNTTIVNYIELRDGADIKAVENAAGQLIKKNADEFTKANLTVYAMPLKKYYLEANDRLIKKMLYTLFFISAFILLMAVVNFINISIGRSAGRMREIGVRKVLGGVKDQLILQFLTESIVLVFLSALFSLLIYQASRPLFSEILGKQLNNLHEFPLAFFAVLLLVALVTGLLAGIFPAFALSSLKTVDSLKGKLSTVKENIFLRKMLVGFQFSMATFILVGAFVISKQVSLFFSKQLGYDKEYILSVTTPRNWTHAGVEHMQAMRNKFARLPYIKGATVSYAIPNGRTSGSISLKKKGGDAPEATTLVLEADSRYADTYGIPMLAGTFFSDNIHDTNNVVINEAAAKAMGWTNPVDAIGRQVTDPASGSILTVKGITKDFHFTSMKENIKPLCFINLDMSPRYRFMSFKLGAGDLTQNIASLQQKWAELFPGTPFAYTFMDETLAGLYQTEIQLKKAAYTATGLSIVIVLLGIIGLVSISIQKRVKEIGIRKVLGSSVSGIISLFLKDFLVIALFAGVIACPLAYYVFQNWLNNYTYNIDLTAEPFVLSVLILSAVTLVLISIQTLKAAVTNPVQNLRTE